MNKLITKLLVGVLFVLGAVGANAQVTVTNPTNTTPAMAATYATLALAIADVNNRTAISGPVTITLDPATPQTATAGGYSITANTATCTGLSATNNFIFAGSGNTITAGVGVSTTNDAIFKLIGADFITIQNFTLQEAGSNLTQTTVAEWGIALLYASITNGAQNNTIQNNTITLNRSFSNTFGIYSNVRHTATSATVTADITLATGSNLGNKVYSNTISNVERGIVFIGSNAAAAMDNGNDIGGSSLATANTITNWGGLVSGALSGYVGVTGSSVCIQMNHQIGDNVSFNTLTSATNITTLTTTGFLGILKNYGTTQPTGTFTSNYNNNTVTLTNAATTSQMTCIGLQGMTALSTATFNCNNNSILNCAVTGASATSATMIGMLHSSAPGTFNINGNTVRGFTSTSTTGGFTGIQQQTNGVVTALNMNNNKIGDATAGAITFSNATSGALSGIVVISTGAASTCAVSITGNDIRGITYNTASSAANTYISQLSPVASATIDNNTFTNLSVNTSGAVLFINHGYSIPATGQLIINNNRIVTGFTRTAAGSITITTTNFTSGTGSVNNYTNNNFSNITVPDNASSTILGFNNTDGGTGSTKQVTGNTFNNWHGGTIGTTGTSSTITCMNFTYWNGVSSLSNNTITNITGRSTITAINLGSASNAATSLAVATNTINNISSIGTGGAVTGISCSNTSTLININNNAISTLSSTGASAVSGIVVSGATTTNVFKNTICDISGSNASSTVNGILVSAGTTINVSNNRIGDLRTTAANAANPLNGLNITGGTTVNAYYNTVNLNGASSGALFGSSAISASTSPTLTLNNNIFANTSTPKGAGLSVAYRRASTTLTTYTATSNRNDFFATTIFTDGTNTYTTIGAYITAMATRDANSFSENPPFLSTTCGDANFLKINTATPTQIESGGVNIAGITDDFENEIRQGNGGYAGTGTLPDIGADEFNGTPAVAMTYVSSTTTQANTSTVNTNTTNQVVIGIEIVTAGSLTPLSTTSFDINTTGTTSPATDITNAKIFYTGTSSTFAPSNQFGATVATPNGAHVVPGTQVLSTGTNYFWLTYDIPCSAVGGNVIDGECTSLTVGLAQTPTVTAPVGSRSIVSGVLSGTYTVGSGGAYTTLTAAAAAVNTGGLGGNVTLSILNNLTEAGAVTFNQWAECAPGGYTLTIKPAAGTTPTISASVASGAVIVLNGADRVTIDGSNNGSSSKDLTITNTATTAPTVISLVSLGLGVGANSNTIKNCNISTGVNATVGYGISIGGATPGTSGADNDNNTIQNNAITFATAPVYAIGTANISAGGLDNLLITQNTVDFNTTLNALIGIRIGNAINAEISRNAISLETTQGTLVGISLETGTVSSSVSRNLISKIKATSTSALPVLRGISIGTAQTGSAIVVSNNVIYNVISFYSTSNAASNNIGIIVGAIGASTTTTTVTGGVNVYFNSINLSGNVDRNTACLQYGMFVGSAVTSLDLRNNIIANSIVNVNSTAGLSKSYAIYSAAANTAFSNINYNDYYVSGAQGVVGFLTSDRVDLAGIQSGFGQNVNSLVADPLFNSNTNLVPQLGSPLLLVGDNSTGVAIDFLGTARTATPTIGAYENAADLSGPVITYTALTNTCGLGNRTLTAAITDPSGVPTLGAGLPVLYWRIGAGAWTPATGTFISGNNYDFIFGNGVVATNVVQYYIVAQDAFGTPNVSSFPSAGAAGFTINPPAAATPPTTPSSYTIQTTLAAGTYTVGGAGTYTTLTAAITAYNTSCLGGAITFSLIDASYTEGAAMTINANADASAVNTLTIKPTLPNTTIAVTGGSTGAIITFNGADYVTIDGSIAATANNVCPPSAASRDLTITNTNTGTSSAVIWLTNTGANGASNNTIKNCNIVGNSPTTTLVGVGSGGSIGAAATAANNNNSYINNNISKAVFGVVSFGTSAAIKNTGTVINQNSVNTASPNNVSRGGVFAGFENGVIISGNNVSNISGTTSNYAMGISCGLLGTTTTSTTGSEVTDATITKNLIGSVRAASTYGVSGIAVASATSGTTLVANNMVSDAFANGTLDDIGAGIYIGGGTGSTTNVFYNSIQMASTLGGGSFYNFGIAINGANPVVNLRNNIVTNTGSNGANNNRALGLAYALPATNLASNYNDLFVSGTSAAIAQTGTLSNSGFVSHATLANWRTNSTQDANSINVAPVFTSATDLHLVATSNCGLDGLGTPVSVTDDIDCATRNITTPDMGADEFISAASNVLYNTVNTTVTDTRAVTATEIFRSSACDRFAQLTPNGGSPVNGNVTARVYKYATVQTYNGEPYVQRVIDITPASGAATATGRVTLYYTQTEFTDFNTANGPWPDLPTGPADATGISNLRITKYGGTPSATPSSPNMYSAGTYQNIDPANGDIVWNATDNRWEVSVDIIGFSGFYVHTNAQFALAISVNYLRGNKVGTTHNLNWKVTCTSSPSATMVLERSGNNRTFNAINTINADALRCLQPFNYVDASPLVGINYYRLRITDAYGKVTYSNTIAMVNKQTGIDIVGIVPNPVTNNGVAILNVASAQKGTLRLVVTDVTGRQLMVQTEAIIAGSNQLLLNVAKLAAGSYQVTAITDDGKSTSVRFIKQ